MDFVRIPAPVPTFKKSFPATVQRFHKLSRPKMNHTNLDNPMKTFHATPNPKSPNHPRRSKSNPKSITPDMILMANNQVHVPRVGDRKNTLDMLKLIIPSSMNHKNTP